MIENERKNMEFRAQFCETNLRYVYGGTTPNETLVSELKQEIKWCNQQFLNNKIDFSSHPKYTTLIVA